MSAEAVPLPGLGAIQAALRRVTESLALEIASPRAEAPLWSELEWRLAPAVAAMHGVSALLALRLRWRGPPSWADFLIEQHQQTVLRQQRIAALLEELEESAREAGIAIVPLKGAALIEAGVYAPGERPMADIDLLTAPSEIDDAVALLLALDYRDAGTTWKHQAFNPVDGRRRALLGEHADEPVKIDLHRSIGERLPLTLINLTDIVYPRDPSPGFNSYPSRAALMVHLLAHTAGNMVCRGARLIQLCDIMRLAARMTATDWEQVTGFDTRRHGLWWTTAPLALAERYFPGSIPAPVRQKLASGCPWLLRKVSSRRSLSDFSYSHLHIDPIPGVVWARSAGEMLRYLAARAWPDRQQRAEREVVSKMEPFASDPSWHEQSQLGRILTWVCSHPARTATLQPVRAALARMR